MKTLLMLLTLILVSCSSKSPTGLPTECKPLAKTSLEDHYCFENDCSGQDSVTSYDFHYMKLTHTWDTLTVTRVFKGKREIFKGRYKWDHASVRVGDKTLFFQRYGTDIYMMIPGEYGLMTLIHPNKTEPESLSVKPKEKVNCHE